MAHSTICWIVSILTLTLFVPLSGCRSNSADSSKQPVIEKVTTQTHKTESGRMPEFTLRDVSGREVSSGQFEGKVMLVDFWATWCAPCRKEMPGFEELNKRYKDRGFAVIGIALDSDPAIVTRFAKEIGVTYTLLMGNSDVQERWGGLQGIPTTFLVDRNRVIRRKVIGFEYKEAFEAALKEIL